MTDHKSPAPVRVLSYERVSGASQVLGTGLGRQADLASQWCRINGHELDTITTLRDEGKSAWRGKHLSDGALGQILSMCASGEIQPGTVLLVEAIDRLSRLEPMTGLEDVVFKLVRHYGLTVITLEDGQEYSRERIAKDTAALVILAVKIQTAHEYSQRASRRLRAAYRDKWEDARRGRFGPLHYKLMPKWIDLDRETGEVSLNSHADSLRLMLKLLEENGQSAVAKELNSRGIPPVYGKEWAKVNISDLTNNDAVFGTLTLRSSRGLTAARKKELLAEGVQIDEKIPGVLPAVAEESYVRMVRAKVSKRANTPGRCGPITSFKWFGQGVTYCECGSLCGRIGTDLKPYLGCKHRLNNKNACATPLANLNRVAYHLLSRLSPRQLEMLTGGSQDRDADLMAAVKVRDMTDANLLEMTTRYNNAKDALKAAIAKGWDLEAFQEAIADSKKALAEANSEHAKASANVSNLQSDRHHTSMSVPVEELRVAVLSGTDTSGQRRAVNKGLRDLGLRIIMGDGRIGIQIGQGQPIWQPLGSLQSERAALAGGYTDSERVAVGGVMITTAPVQTRSQHLQTA